VREPEERQRNDPFAKHERFDPRYIERQASAIMAMIKKKKGPRQWEKYYAGTQEKFTKDKEYLDSYVFWNMN
jgi:hypothetical protein